MLETNPINNQVQYLILKKIGKIRPILIRDQLYHNQYSLINIYTKMINNIPEFEYKLVVALRNTYSEGKLVAQSQNYLQHEAVLSKQLLVTIQSILSNNYQKHLKIAAISYISKLLAGQLDHNISSLEEITLWIIKILKNGNMDLAMAATLCEIFNKLRPSAEQSILIHQQISHTIQLVNNQPALNTVTSLLQLVGSLISTLDAQDSDTAHIIFKSYLLHLVNYGCKLVAVMEQELRVLDVKSEDFKQEQISLLSEQISLIDRIIKIFDEYLYAFEGDETITIQIEDLMEKEQPVYRFLKTILSMNMYNSKQIIMDTNLTIDEPLNNLKASVTKLVNNIYPSPHVDMFGVYFETFIRNSNGEKSVESSISTILQNMFLFLERCAVDKTFTAYFTKYKIHIGLHMFDYFITNSKELEYIHIDPEYFVELSTDVCETQDLQEVKTKAVSFLSSLTMAVDGLLSHVVQTALILIDAIYFTPQTSHNRFQLMLTAMKNYQFFNLENQFKVEIPLMVLASLFDQIAKRPQLQLTIQQILQYRKDQLRTSTPIVVCRLIQLCTYFPSKSYTQYFVSQLPHKEQIINFQIIKYLQRFVKYQKSPEQLCFLGLIVSDILQRVSCYNPVFEDIVLRQTLCLNTKQKISYVINRIVVDIQKTLAKVTNKTVSNVNKLTNMLNKLMTKIDIMSYQKQVSPVFKLLNINANCQEYIIDIAINFIRQHSKVTQIQHQFLNDVLNIVVKNKYNLNNSFELMNLHLAFSDRQDSKWKIVKLLIECLQNNSELTDNVEFCLLLEIFLTQNTLKEDALKMVLDEILRNLQINHNEHYRQHLIAQTILSAAYRHSQYILQWLNSHNVCQYFLKNWLSRVKDLFTTTAKRMRCLYLLSLVNPLLELSDQYASLMLKQVIYTFTLYEHRTMKINNTMQDENSVQKQKEDINIYEIPDSVATTYKLKQQKMIHPLNNVDEFEFFKLVCENLNKKMPQFFTKFDIDKKSLNDFLTRRVVQAGVTRRILKIRRG